MDTELFQNIEIIPTKKGPNRQIDPELNWILRDIKDRECFKLGNH